MSMTVKSLEELSNIWNTPNPKTQKEPDPADTLRGLRIDYEINGQPASRFITITPEDAADLLKNHNPFNRNLRRGLVGTIASDILAGRWKTNGETIIIDENGDLNDGQHRLAAVVKSGKSISTLVVYGVDRITRDTVDMGAARTTADILNLNGTVQYSTQAAAVAGQLLKFQTGRLFSGDKNVSKTATADTYYANRADIDRAVGFFNRSKTSRRIYAMVGGSTVEVLVLLFARAASWDLAEEFWTLFGTGTNLEPGSPILTFRNRIMVSQSSTRAAKLTPDEKGIFAIRAWNNWRKGVLVGHIRRSAVDSEAGIPPISK